MEAATAYSDLLDRKTVTMKRAKTAEERVSLKSSIFERSKW